MLGVRSMKQTEHALTPVLIANQGSRLEACINPVNSLNWLSKSDFSFLKKYAAYFLVNWPTQVFVQAEYHFKSPPPSLAGGECAAHPTN